MKHLLKLLFSIAIVFTGSLVLLPINIFAQPALCSSGGAECTQDPNEPEAVVVAGGEATSANQSASSDVDTECFDASHASPVKLNDQTVEGNSKQPDNLNQSFEVES